MLTHQVVDEGDDNQTEAPDVGREADAHAAHLRRVLLGGEGVDDEEGGGLGELGHEVEHERGHRGVCVVGRGSTKGEAVRKVEVL